MDGRAILMNARPLTSGGAVLVIHDLSEIRRLEAVRRDFVANVSHELKTPLTSISGYAETLLTDTPDADTTRRFLATILDNARRMQRLVDDLLDLWRASRQADGSRSRSRVDVAEAARESLERHGDRGSAREISYRRSRTRMQQCIRADPMRFDRCSPTCSRTRCATRLEAAASPAAAAWRVRGSPSASPITVLA